MAKRFIKIACLSLTIPCLFACRKNSDSDSHKVDNPDTITESAKEASGYVTNYPSQVSGALHNKGMGWIALEEQTELGKLDLGKNGTLPEVDNIGIQTSWALIEKNEGVFDWSLIDETIDYWTKQNKRINLRICTDSLSLPEVFFGAPRWLNEKYGVHYQEYTYSGSVKARVNDLTDPTYQKYFEIFMQKLSERYADNEYVDTIDIRGFGMFGEWHSGHTFASMEERMFTLAYIVDVYAEAFAKKGKTLFLSNSWDYQGINDDGSSAAKYGNSSYEDYLAWSSFDHAMKLEYIGFRRDGMAGNGVTKYSTDEKALTELIRSGKKVSNCGEYFSGISNFLDSLAAMDPVEATEELMFKSHCNYSTVLGWTNIEVSNIVERGYGSVYNRGNEKMGFRFKTDLAKFPSGVKQGNNAYVLTKISNSGVGRFTLPDHNIRLYLINESGKIKQYVDNKSYDLRILLNGETMNAYTSFKVKEDLEDGEYTLALAIVDKYGNPDIRLAQVGNYEQMIYPLGKMQVGNYEDVQPFYEEVDLDEFEFKGNDNYEVTFSYTPSVKLEDFEFGDTHGFEVALHSKDESYVIANFQDVSGETAVKTVEVITSNKGPYKLSIYGTGLYQNKIEIGKVFVEKKSGYLQKFNADYNLLSSKNAWYSEQNNVYVLDEGVLKNDGAVLIEGELDHKRNDGLMTDPNILKLKKNTSYTISFSTKGYYEGGNACYYYLSLDNNEKQLLNIAEWYDRPDEPNNIKTFTFITPDDDNLHLNFGVKNQGGGYLLEYINLIENPSGVIINGEDVKHINNVRPYDSNRGFNYVETFEDMVLNDATFTYGFNRWGHLTNDPSEVIEGNFSFTSRLDPETYRYYNEDDWFEFMYSNSKYLKFKPNTKYRLAFDYRLVEPIYLVSDSEKAGFAYVLGRSLTNSDDAVTALNGFSDDSSLVQFTKNEGIGEIKHMIYEFQTGSANDYYLIIGVFGRGVLIVDNVIVSEI